MRPQEYQWRKTKQRLRRSVWVSGIVASVAVLLLGTFLWVPYFRISSITTFDEYISSDLIATSLAPLLEGRAAYLAPRDHILIFSNERAELLLAREGIGRARVTKRFPHALTVEFLEFIPHFLYCYADNCFYVDRNGLISESAPTFSVNPLPIIEIDPAVEPFLGEAIITVEEAQFLTLFFKELKSLEIEPRHIAFLDDVHIETTETWEIVLRRDVALNPKELAERVSLLLSERIKDDRADLSYIDLRLENKAFYKFR